MKPNQKKHIKATVLQAATIIELDNILDFYQLVEQHLIKEVFLIENNLKFAVLTQNAVLQTVTNDFLTIEDAKNATVNQFPNAKDFYAAAALHISKYEDYQLIVVCGIKDKNLYNQIHKEGFVSGFEEYKKFISDENHDNGKTVFPNVLALFNFAKANNFKKFENFFEAFKLGFENYENYQIALEKGFENAHDFKIALENGFPNNELYQIAIEDKVKTYKELEQKLNLEMSYPNLKHDESVLLFLLSKLEQNKKVSLNKIQSLLEKVLEEYENPSSKKLEDWFSRSLHNPQNIADFLIQNNDVKKFGSFDVDGEFFEINTIKDRSIVIDGSNVAHNSKNGESKKPMIANLITMVHFLKTKGFTDILIIADASLRHKLGDIERLKELNEIAKYEIAPAETSADTFLISHVKAKHCLILSNDTFKQYKIADAWTATNIDYYRLTFMITDGEVFMPDLK